MVALTGDFHVFTSRFTTRVSAVLLSISYIAKTLVCERIFWWFESPSSVLSSPTLLAFSDGYATGTLTSCMQISKRRLCWGTKLSAFSCRSYTENKLPGMSTG